MDADSDEEQFDYHHHQEEVSNDEMDEIMKSIHKHQEDVIKSMRKDDEYEIGIIPELYPKEEPNNSDDEKLQLKSIVNNKMNNNNSKSISHQHEGAAGWHSQSPARGYERHHMKEECGSTCFLDPKREKYPICDEDCSVDCRGLHAAYIRAKQYHREDIAEKAQRLLKKYNC